MTLGQKAVLMVSVADKVNSSSSRKYSNILPSTWYVFFKAACIGLTSGEAGGGVIFAIGND